MTYLRTLDAAGAIPVVLPPTGTDHLEGLLDRLLQEVSAEAA